ncbi:MAG: aminotransferase class III-fold pyridoxal phosphate-dependent enzyme, partial [Candidatus Heimdallarchaeaceae archaeon]
DMVRATKYLEVIEKDNLVSKAASSGEYLLKQLLELQEEVPDKISNVRGRGLMVAFDLPTSELRDKVKNEAYKNKMIILACGEKSIRFRPPLIIEKEEIDKGMAILREVVKGV